MFLENVLNPRVANEIIAPWRSYFRKTLPPLLIENAPENPVLVAEYLEKNIRIADDENYYKTPLTPVGVCELKVSDSFSRDICFVAICRSIGIPSRLEPGSNVPQYFFNSEWNDHFFQGRSKPTGKRGYVRLFSDDYNPVPEYYIHFTLARFENGRYNTLEYDFNKKITEFKDELALAPGNYMLVTGNRLTDSRILSSLNFFDLDEGEHKPIEVKIRKDSTRNSKIILGTIDIMSILGLLDRPAVKNDRILEKGLAILWIDPGKEPTRHVFNDLPHLKAELDEWGGYFLFLTDPDLKWEGFTSAELKSLPANLICGYDNKLLYSDLKSFDSSGVRLPFVIVADRNGNVMYASSGYRIGIGEQILKFARK
jgi:hypothetical protein